MSKRLGLWAVAAAALLGCREADVVVEDGLTSPVSGWVVLEQPMISIGKEGDPRYQFTNVVGMGRLPGGHWYAFDRASAELRIYNEKGGFVHATGGRGEGPGEFLDVHFAAHTSAGNIYTYDQRLRRLSTFDSDGEFLGSVLVTATAPGTVFRAVGVSSNGNVVWASSIIPPCVSGVVRQDTVVYFTQAVQSGRGGRLQLTPPDSALPLDSVGGALRWGNTVNRLQACIPNTVPFSHWPLDAVAGTSLYIALRDQLGIIITDLTTGQTRRAAEVERRQLITDSHVTAYIQQIESMVQRDENGAELPATSHLLRRLRETPFPDSLPISGQLAVDALGYAWVRPYDGSGESAGWWIFSPEAEFEGRIRLPDQLLVKDIGADYVAGVQLDEFGVPRLLAYPLVRRAN